MELPGFIG